MMLTEGPLTSDRGAQAPLEREHELSELDGLIGSARDAHGRLLLIEGPAGIGKTRLLEAARSRASALGVTPLAARGGELERDFGFGIVRQLFEPVLTGIEPAARARLLAGAAHLAEPVFAAEPDAGEGGLSDPTHPVLHGLYWLVANLADGSPLLLLIDDVHWADRPSLRFLVHLVRRLDGLPAAIAVAARAGEETDQPELLRALVLEARPPILRPRPLSATAVTGIVKAALGEEAEMPLATACHEATGGNPFLVNELVEELQRDSRPVSDISPGAVRELASERIAAAVLLRVGRLDPLAPSFAHAVAVLGPHASLERAADLAGVELGQAGRLAAALADVDVLEPGAPLRFVHPLVRASVYDDMPPRPRAALHRRAADLLAAEDADPHAIALHLLSTEAAGDPQVVATLHRAATAALLRGAPESAIALLGRAIAEPPAELCRASLHHQLGSALARVGDPQAREHLERALTLETDSEARARIAFDLSQLLLFSGDMPAAIEVLERALEGLAEASPVLAGRLEGQLLPYGTTSVTGRNLLRSRLRNAARRLDQLPIEQARFLRPPLAFNTAVGEPANADAATSLARQALADPVLFEDLTDATALYGATEALWVTGKYEESEHAVSRLLAAAQERGSARGYAMASAFRAWRRYLRGELRGAEADARACLEQAASLAEPAEALWALFTPLAAAVLAGVILEQGDVAGAREALGPGAPFEDDEDFGFVQILHMVDARVALADGHPSRSIELLERCRRFEQAWDANAGLACAIPWRVPASAARLALGEHREGRALAAEQLALAREFGVPRELGVALGAQARVEGGEAAIELLSEAVDVLAGADAQVEHARAVIELGAALRRAGKRVAAREQLLTGMDAAHRVGATTLAEQARNELVVAGARPRRRALSGLDALTARERQVAEMAADGMTNKEIAQALFVTLRTAEMHLSNAYRKLRISSRQDLPRALERPDSG